MESSNKKVLIIEDDISLCDNLKQFLDKKNFHTLFCHTGKEVLDTCIKQAPDLILCDIQLPDSSGLSVIQELKKNELTKTIPFIFMSAFADAIDVQTGLNLGAKEYLTKPFKLDNLHEVIYNTFTAAEEEKQTILVIEDDPDIRDNLNCLFLRNGYDVMVASNGRDGLEKATFGSPNVIICDIMLPDLNGYSVLEEMSRNDKTQTIPFIYLSAKSELSDIRTGMSIGADDYITKPFNSKDLLNSVQKRISKLSNIKKQYKTSSNLLEGQNEINEINESSQNFEQNLKKVLLHENAEIEKSSADELINIKLSGNEIKNEENYSPTKISREAETKPSSKLSTPGYDDNAFEFFLSNRNDSVDYQSYCYRNIFVIMNNLRVAIQKESILFYQYLQNAIDNGYKNIVIDMSASEIIDSTYIGVLISCKRLIYKKEGKIKLVMKIRNQFSSMMLQQSVENNFELFGDIKAAIQSY